MKRLLSAFSIKRNFKLLLFRPSTNMATVDGFRALSMLLVIAFHAFSTYAALNPKIISISDLVAACGWTWGWVWNADKGVDIFFVISGYLITGLLLRQIDSLGHIRMSNFYVRRFMRLSPVYYVLIGLYLFICIKFKVVGGNFESLWANALYINNFLPYEQQAMNWTWSLAIEEQFYLLYPLLLGLIMKNSERPIFWLWFAYGVSFLICFGVIFSDETIRNTPGSQLVASASYHAHYFSVFYDNLYTRYGALIAGAIAAYYQHYHRDQVTRFFASVNGQVLGWVGLLTVIVIMGVPVLMTTFDEWKVFAILYHTGARNLFAGGVAVLILVSAETGVLSKGLRAIFAHPAWYPLAQLSYSMYLLHVFVVLLASAVVGQWVTKYPEKYPWDIFQSLGVVYLMSVVVTVIFASVLYLFIERPIMNLRK